MIAFALRVAAAEDIEDDWLEGISTTLANQRELLLEQEERIKQLRLEVEEANARAEALERYERATHDALEELLEQD